MAELFVTGLECEVAVYVGSRYVDIVAAEGEVRVAHGDLVDVLYQSPSPSLDGCITFGTGGPRVWFAWDELDKFLQVRSAIEGLLPK